MMLYIPILLGSIIVISLKLYEHKKLTSIFQGFTDLRAFRRVIREEALIKGWMSSLLLVNTVLIVSSAITYSLFTKYDVAKFGLNIYAIFFITCAILIGYYWTRKILFFFIGYFSEQPFIANEINTYNKFFYQVLGIIMIPMLFFANFRLTDSDITWLAFLLQWAISAFANYTCFDLPIQVSSRV